MDGVFHLEGPIEQLGGTMSSYAGLRVPGSIVAQLPKKNRTRLLVVVEDMVELPCGLTSFGDGDYFFMFAKRNRKKVGKDIGETVQYTVQEHPLPLGVEMSEVLEVLLEQDENARRIWDDLTDGRKRTIIFSIGRIKDIDRQIQTIINLLNQSLKS
ncbi:DUF1905 domain-containing protein [Cryomorphaceae bacterium]|nr:DUF1905 domain-containing protein [Cryomorphaceae bacterium]